MFTPANSFVSLVERMDILEFEKRHFIQATKERFQDMERRSEAQFAKMDGRLDRLERAFDRLEEAAFDNSSSKVFGYS